MKKAIIFSAIVGALMVGAVVLAWRRKLAASA